MERLFYSVREVAEILGISKSYAYQMVKEKKLPVLDLGSRKVIPKVLFEEWVSTNIKSI